MLIKIFRTYYVEKVDIITEEDQALISRFEELNNDVSLSGMYALFGVLGVREEEIISYP